MRPSASVLVTHLHDDAELMGAALAKADELLAHGAWAVSLTKEAMWASLEIPGLQAAIDLENRQQILLGTHARVPRSGGSGLWRHG